MFSFSTEFADYPDFNIDDLKPSSFEPPKETKPKAVQEKWEPITNPAKNINPRDPNTWPPCYVCDRYKTVFVTPKSYVPICERCVDSLR